MSINNSVRTHSFASLLLYLVIISSLIIAFIFFTGWAYAYHYFSHFNVGLLALNMPVVTYLGFSFWVFQSWWWLLFPYILFIGILIVFETRISVLWNQIKESRPLLLIHIQIVFTLLAFLLAWWATEISAERFFQQQKANRFSDLPLVRVWLNKPPVDETLLKLYEELPKGIYCLLLENQFRGLSTN